MMTPRLVLAPVSPEATHRAAETQQTTSTARSKIKTFHEEDTGLYKVILECVKVVVYYCVGVLFYHFTEGWSCLTSVYFTSVSILTVGYGDVAPTSDSARLFTMVYVLVGLAVIFRSIAGLGEHVVTAAENHLLDRLAGEGRHATGSRQNSGGPSACDSLEPWPDHPHSSSSEEEEEEEDQSELERVAKQMRRHKAKMVFTAGVLLVPLLVGSVCLWVLNKGRGHLDHDSDDVKRWRYMDGLWYSFCTLTTIGYGDMSYRATTPTRAFLCVFMPCSVVFGAAAIGNVASILKDIREEQRQFELLERMDFQMLSEMDRNGDGVDKVEYVLAMIKAMNLVDEKKIARFEKQFDEADVDSSGKLDSDDLLAIARERERVKDRHMGFHEAKRLHRKRGPENAPTRRFSSRFASAMHNLSLSASSPCCTDPSLSCGADEAPADASPSLKRSRARNMMERVSVEAARGDCRHHLGQLPPPPLPPSRRTPRCTPSSASARGDLAQVAEALAGLVCAIRPGERERADSIRDDMCRGELARATLALRELAGDIAEARERLAEERLAEARPAEELIAERMPAYDTEQCSSFYAQASCWSEG